MTSHCSLCSILRLAFLSFVWRERCCCRTIPSLMISKSQLIKWFKIHDGSPTSTFPLHGQFVSKSNGRRISAGSDEEQMSEFRRVRDEIRAKIENEFAA